MSPRTQLDPPCDASSSGRAERRAATRLSGRCAALLTLVLSTSGCLVTSTPDFTPPKRSAPILIPSTADPDPRAMFIVEKIQFDKEQSFYFRAHVLPGNNDDTLHFKFYVDYGFADNPDERLPYWGPTALGLPALDPSTVMDAGQLAVEARWDPKSYSSGAGCHNVTLIASHEFDEFTGCPLCMNDSSQITWQVYLCGQDPCVFDFSKCQGWKESCRDAQRPGTTNQCGASP